MAQPSPTGSLARHNLELAEKETTQIMSEATQALQAVPQGDAALRYSSHLGAKLYQLGSTIEEIGDIVAGVDFYGREYALIRSYYNRALETYEERLMGKTAPLAVVEGTGRLLSHLRRLRQGLKKMEEIRFENSNMRRDQNGENETDL